MLIANGSYTEKKVQRKQRRCLTIIEKDTGIQRSDAPTKFLAILNVGLSNGLTEEKLLNAALPLGQVSQVLMIPGKSYSFLQAATAEDANIIYLGLHNIAKIGQKDAVTYLSFVNQLPATIEIPWNNTSPPGLIVVPDFVTPEEEIKLLKAVGTENETNTNALKHRQVKHFGYEFLYGINNVDSTRPLESKIPEACDILWPRLKDATIKQNLDNLEWFVPDQLTVNEYEPGQGIPPHVDTHSAFLDPILSLSLLDDIMMEFRRGTKERASIFLPRRSLLIISGESRFDWTHGITPKHYDVIPTAGGTLTTKQRGKRISLTFRRLRRGPCSCNFPTLCDTRQSETPQQLNQKLEEQAVSLEQQNVHEIYDKIANHFSETRHSPWPRVVDFLQTFSSQSIVIDVGCGNGKYLNCNPNIITIGCDRSTGLLDVCKSRGNSVFRCDCLFLPVRDASIDGCISIAVIHHLATQERRLAAVREMSRVLRSGGRALIYVWAKDQKRESSKSSYLLQNKSINKQRTTEQQQRQRTAQELCINMQSTGSVPLPIHTNRTQFQQQDVLVPWKTNNTTKEIFLRYYHVFDEGELQSLVSSVPTLVLEETYYDQGNHCVIFRRK